MATSSGTVNATTVDITTLMEHAVRRCGVLPSMFSSELQLAAKESLFFLLADLSNDGISLWCVSKAIMPVVAGQAVYLLPPGTTDVLSGLYRTSTVLTGTPYAGVDYAATQFAVASAPTNVELTFTASATPALVVESSADNATWTQVAAFSTFQSAVPAGQPIALDIDNQLPALYWRVRSTTGTMPAGAVLTWNSAPIEIPMSPFNKDDYFSMPNKTVQAAKALQYWFDKQLNPQLRVWPVSNSPADQIVVWYHHLVEDVGSLAGLLAVPSRWYEYIIFAWACRIAIEIPPSQLPPGRLDYLESQREASLDRAAIGESDGAPYRLQPNLRGYT